MSSRFQIKKAIPTLGLASSERSSNSSGTIISLDIHTKIVFQNVDGSNLHEYFLPSNRHIQNCGGYIDKLIKYRSPEIRMAVLELVKSGDKKDQLPDILQGRSILVDTIIAEMIERFVGENPTKRAKIFDHGCTVAEHYEMLDQMLYARSGLTNAQCISYFGLDVSPLVLSAARMLHPSAPKEHFHLALAEGSDISMPENSMDFSMSIGVINHVQKPLQALERLIEVTRYATIVVIWVTGENEGFWATNHSGIPNYFFSVSDLKKLSGRHSSKGNFYFLDFTPETSSTQPSSYVGLSNEKISQMGSYTMIFCNEKYKSKKMNLINLQGKL